VKPPPFDYLRPTTVAEAVGLLATPGRKNAVLAGGQSLVRLLNLRQARPDVVIDINRIPGLDGVEIQPTAVRVGALARLADLEGHEGLRTALPVLGQAVALVGHPQIRNRSTIGGSLCHADPAAELPTVALTLDAQFELSSVAGTRTVSAAEFFRSSFITSRRADEMLTAVILPRHHGMRFRYEEISRRPNDPAIVGVCLGLALDDVTVVSARVGVAAVGDTPRRLPALEARLVGQSTSAGLDPNLDDDLGDVPVTDTDPGARFRRAMLVVALRRAAGTLAGSQREETR
jgi:carbon-monoxide dehydrogenase medium subunit